MLCVFYHRAEYQTHKSEKCFFIIRKRDKPVIFLNQESGPLADFDEINQFKVTVI